MRMKHQASHPRMEGICTMSKMSTNYRVYGFAQDHGTVFCGAFATLKYAKWVAQYLVRRGNWESGEVRYCAQDTSIVVYRHGGQ